MLSLHPKGVYPERLKYKIHLTNLVKTTKVIIMENELFEMGSISSRGQIAIPSDIRKSMGLAEGAKVLFILEDDTLIMKKVTSETFAGITQPLKEAAKKSGLKESMVNGIIHRFRKKE